MSTINTQMPPPGLEKAHSLRYMGQPTGTMSPSPYMGQQPMTPIPGIPQ
jgi:hypothetical protein